MLKLIIFDWDDVFTLGSSQGYYACYKKAVKDAGGKVYGGHVEKVVKDLWGRPHKDVITTILKDAPELVEKANANYEKYLFTNIFSEHLSLAPGSIELLNRLKGRYKMAIATGMNPHLLKEDILPRFKVPPVFSTILTSYDLTDKKRGKPYPDLILKILDNEKVKPEQAVMIGDAEDDILMAKAAGVESVAVLTGQLSKQEAKLLGTDYIIKDVSQLERKVLS